MLDAFQGMALPLLTGPQASRPLVKGVRAWENPGTPNVLRGGNMTRPPGITEHAIEEHVGARSFQRGKRYFQGKLVFNPKFQGNELRGQCQGSRGNVYAVTARISGKGISGSGCSCPVGAACKHVAALLLTWLHRRSEFLEMPDPGTIVRNLDRDQLAGLVLQMIRREPALESLLEMVSPRAVVGGKGKKPRPASPIDPLIVKRQIAAILRGAGGGWGAGAEAADGLSALLETAAEHLKKRETLAAVEIADLISTEVAEGYEMFEDHDGDLASILGDCAGLLDDCLAALPPEDPLRIRVLGSLFDILAFDLEYGGIGVSDEITGYLVARATPDERELVAGWVEENIGGSGKGKGWANERWGGLLLDLREGSLDDEAFLEVCRQTGRTGDLVDRLLDRKRTEEAVQVARQAGEYELAGLAPRFTAHGLDKVAFELVSARAGPDGHRALVDWLRDYYRRTGDHGAGTNLAEQEFLRRPSLAGYQELARNARKVGGWPARREKALAHLVRQKDYATLTRIHLSEGKVDQALETLSQCGVKGGWASRWSDPLELEVARKAEKTHPQSAIDLYKRLAERLIEGGGRPNYRAAAHHLAKVRALMAGLEQKGERLGKGPPAPPGNPSWRECAWRSRTNGRSWRSWERSCARSPDRPPPHPLAAPHAGTAFGKRWVGRGLSAFGTSPEPG